MTPSVLVKGSHYAGSERHCCAHHTIAPGASPACGCVRPPSLPPSLALVLVSCLGIGACLRAFARLFARAFLPSRPRAGFSLVYCFLPPSISACLCLFRGRLRFLRRKCSSCDRHASSISLGQCFFLSVCKILFCCTECSRCTRRTGGGGADADGSRCVFYIGGGAMDKAAVADTADADADDVLVTQSEDSFFLTG